MTRILTDQQIATEALQVGLSTTINAFALHSAVEIATAIALAESGGDCEHFGDIGLQDAKWGPSYGLWQIRTLKKPGKETYRDLNNLQQKGSSNPNDAPREQALAMATISAQGTKWGDWTTYNTGAYLLFLNRAHTAMQAILANGVNPNGGGDPGAVVGDSDGLPSTSAVTGTVDALKAVNKFLTNLGDKAYWRRGVELLAGLALIVAGLVILNRDTIAKAAKSAAEVALL